MNESQRTRLRTARDTAEALQQQIARVADTATKFLREVESLATDLLDEATPPHPPDPPVNTGADMIDMATVTIVNSPDVRQWPITTAITKIEFRTDGLKIDFSKKDGPGRWPDVTPPGWDGPLQYSIWMAEQINGKWIASGPIEVWHGLEASGGDVTADQQIAQNWFYDSRWGALAKRQPKAGEQVGFMVTAGDARGRDVHVVAERSNMVLVPFPERAGTVVTRAEQLRMTKDLQSRGYRLFESVGRKGPLMRLPLSVVRQHYPEVAAKFMKAGATDDTVMTFRDAGEHSSWSIDPANDSNKDA